MHLYSNDQEYLIDLSFISHNDATYRPNIVVLIPASHSERAQGSFARIADDGSF